MSASSPAPAATLAPAKSAPARTARPAIDPLADFKVSTARPAQYRRADRSRVAPVPAIGEVATVSRGVAVKSGQPVLLVENGATQSALALSAIGAAIAGGVITRAEIAALLGE